MACAPSRMPSQAETQIRTDHARELGVDGAALDELLVPAVLERIREPVGEEKRDVDPERCSLAY